MMDDLISRQAAIDAILSIGHKAELSDGDAVIRVSAVNYVLRTMPSAQPEVLACGEGELIAQLGIVRCKDCEYGEQDEYGRWYCRSFGCQVGDEDGNGFCSDAERRTDESN